MGNGHLWKVSPINLLFTFIYWLQNVAEHNLEHIAIEAVLDAAFELLEQLK